MLSCEISLTCRLIREHKNLSRGRSGDPFFLLRVTQPKGPSLFRVFLIGLPHRVFVSASRSSSSSPFISHSRIITRRLVEKHLRISQRSIPEILLLIYCFTKIPAKKFSDLKSLTVFSHCCLLLCPLSILSCCLRMKTKLSVKDFPEVSL